jgi:Plasmid pRiA4b ORF-3-like protein
MTSDDDKPLTPQQARQKLQKGLRDYLAGIDTGPIVFRLKRTKKAGETYPLKLTQLQRETLLQFTQINRTLKRKIKEAGEGTQIVGVTWNELHTLNDATGEAAVYAPSVHEKRLMAVQARVVKFFEEEHAEVFGWMSPQTRKPRLTKSEHLYQFRLTLLETSPPIWRRIQVGDCTLDKLHEHIQTAMGWTNSHLHQFTIDGRLFGDPLLMEEDFDERGFEDSTTTMLSEILPASGKRFRFEYEYDFGDGWLHEVHFEGRLKSESGKRYPLCLEGARACPPEDVGGVTGYADFLEAIADPENEEHDGLLEWAGGRFDPEEFNPVVATRRMKQGLPDWRSMR